MIDAYYDHRGQALCPMSNGVSHHVSPRGDIEPCPIIQLAVEHVDARTSFYDQVTRSALLKEMREAAAGHSRGCVMLENPRLVLEIADRHAARHPRLALSRIDCRVAHAKPERPARC